MPATIKDLLLTAGWPTLRGSRLLDAAGPWPEDAPAVARLRESGAVLLGKTTTPEFGWKGVTDSRRFGATGNPWDPARTAGGSSGGSAAAVGLGMGVWSVGTDGGGSVRIPAGFTGTVALKPTYGLVPLYPPSPFGTLSHAGPMTRSVRDAAALLDIISGFDPRDWSAMPTPAGSFLAALAEPERRPVRAAGRASRRGSGYVRQRPGGRRPRCGPRSTCWPRPGARVEERDPGFADPERGLPRALVRRRGQGAGGLRRRAARPGRPAAAPGRRAGRAATRPPTSWTPPRSGWTWAAGWASSTASYDVLVTPTLPIPAFPIGRDVPDGWPSPWWTSWTPYTYPFNLTQQPALSVPCGFTAAGLPVGLQVVGPRHARRDGAAGRAGLPGAAPDWHTRVPTLREQR